MGDSWNASEWLLDRNLAEGNGDRKAVRVRAVPTTYHQLHELTCSTAAGLRAAGVGPGDRVAFSLLDSLEFTTAFLACLRIGAIACPVNPLLPWRDIGVIVAHAGAGLVLVSAQRAEGMEDLADAVPSAR